MDEWDVRHIHGQELVLVPRDKAVNWRRQTERADWSICHACFCPVAGKCPGQPHSGCSEPYDGVWSPVHIVTAARLKGLLT